MDPLQILQQLLEQSGAERRQAALQQQLATQRSVSRRTLPDEVFLSRDWVQQPTREGMPVFDKADDLGREKQKDIIANRMARGETPGANLYQGLPSTDIAEAQSRGARDYIIDRELGAEKPDALFYTGRGKVTYPTGLENLRKDDADPEVLSRIKRAEAVNDLYKKHGQKAYQAAMLDQDVMQVIADQLMLQRERAGDPTAWMASFPQPMY